MKILKFSTPSCTWCKVATPHVDAYAKEHGLEVTEVNADEETGTAEDRRLTAKHKVMGVPVVVFEDNDQVMAKAMGFPEIMKLLNESRG